MRHETNGKPVRNKGFLGSVHADLRSTMWDNHAARDSESVSEAEVADAVRRRFGRRALLAFGAAAGATTAGHVQAHAAPSVRASGGGILQPGSGRISGKHYLPSRTDEVLWGYVPTVHASPVITIGSGETVRIDAVSHEGILEDQGRDPKTWFAEHGVQPGQVLDDAVAIAAGYDRTERDFGVDGPHVVTGPVAVRGARPGDVLKIETLEATPRVPYGVVSSRHGKGVLARQADGSAPAGITLDEVMPPVETDGRASGNPDGNVSVFTRLRGGRGYMGSGSRTLSFPVTPFFGMMGVAFSEDPGLTPPSANSVPPTLGGGNIDIAALAAGSAFYLPVRTDGALFYVGDPHMAMGDGEVALTAVEGSLRGTFRLTVCRKDEGDAPDVAFGYPFGETDDYWIPVGLSDPNASIDGQGTDLDVAMRRATVNALDFLQAEFGFDRAVAYAYLSAAANFHVSQVVDRTVGVHAMIRKADLP